MPNHSTISVRMRPITLATPRMKPTSNCCSLLYLLMLLLTTVSTTPPSVKTRTGSMALSSAAGTLEAMRVEIGSTRLGMQSSVYAPTTGAQSYGTTTAYCATPTGASSAQQKMRRGFICGIRRTYPNLIRVDLIRLLLT